MVSLDSFLFDVAGFDGAGKSDEVSDERVWGLIVCMTWSYEMMDRSEGIQGTDTCRLALKKNQDFTNSCLED